MKFDQNYSWNYSSWQDPSSYDVSSIRQLTDDRDGNHSALTRRTETGSADTYSYNYAAGSNRLTGVTKNGVNTAFGYDRNGNVTTIGTGYSITGTSYDWRNLPLSIFQCCNGPSLINHTYKYDHQGNRTYKNSGATRYVRGAFGEVLAVYSGSALQYHNILRPDGTVIGRREGSNRFYYHRDHLGSTRAVVNGSGSVVETQDYYPFGLSELVPNTFGMPGRSMTAGNSAKEKFTSHELDAGLDLYYMVARRYAPEFGRFLGVDPITHTLNPRELFDLHNGKHFTYSPYAYVFNNPLRYIDPTGLTPEDPEEIARFRQAEISFGLQHMLNLMNEHGVEIASFMVQDNEGNVELVVFDFSGNTEDSSQNPRVGRTASGKTLFDGAEVIAQIHTQPNDNPTPSGDDQEVSRQLRAPVFTLTNNNMGVTVGGAGGRPDNPSLGRSFKESVVNRGRSDRLIDFAQRLKGVIERGRRN